MGNSTRLHETEAYAKAIDALTKIKEQGTTSRDLIRQIAAYFLVSADAIAPGATLADPRSIRIAQAFRDAWQDYHDDEDEY